MLQPNPHLRPTTQQLLSEPAIRAKIAELSAFDVNIVAACLQAKIIISGDDNG